MIDFQKLRHDKRFHLGLGDVRLTIAMQDEIESALSRKDARIAKLEAALQYYAYGNYERKKWDFDCGLEEPSEIEEDGGAIARAALEADHD